MVAETVDHARGRALSNRQACTLLLAYVLGRRSRAQLARQYGLHERQVGLIVSGDGYGDATLALRERLLSLGIGNARMVRSEDRQQQVGAAFARLAIAAAELLDLDGRPEARQLVADVRMLLGEPAAHQ